MNSGIVEKFENELRVSHRVIAEQVGIQQKNIVELLRKYEDDFLEFGTLPFQTEGIVNNGKGEQPKTFYLNEQQATLLMTYLRNSEKVRVFKKILVKEFFQMRTAVKELTSTKVNLTSLEERAKLLEISQKEYKIFEDVFYRIGITRPEELAITSNRAVQKETGVDFIELAEKKGISTPEKYFTVTELCQKVMSSDEYSDEAKKLVSTKAGNKPRPQNLNKLLEESGYQTKTDSEWKQTERGKAFSDLVQNKAIGSDKTVFHLLWRSDVLEELF
jgi:phage regulator Rha-like protein